MSFLEFLDERKLQILRLTLVHLQLTGISVLLAIVVGVPSAILLTRFRWLAKWVLGVAGVFQTIPSLAVLGFLLPIPIIGGIGATPAIVALFLYSLLAIMRNTFTGIDEIPRQLIEAADGMGMTDWQKLLIVELPLALPTIMAGVRISTVICIGIATLSAAIGAGGLGQLIFRGLAMVDNNLIFAGAIPAALLAIILDNLFGRFEKMMTPWKNENSNGSQN